jgi:uncharacterized lipoprotein YddW (UPF0748 family)
MFWKPLLGLLLIAHISIAQKQESPKREFRAAWVATIGNIDWPSKKGLSTAQQQAELLELLDHHRNAGMNAIIFQIRPAADAFFPSPFEPWSEYLTGRQGQAPLPYYDPLEFMITETHKRGMEFHAWFNPYRAVVNYKTARIDPNHITIRQPMWFVNYDAHKYFDPGYPEVRAYVVSIIKDVVQRYDVDAIHFDDYFYPYPVKGKDFPDSRSYAIYGKNQDRGDWRRSNVDSIIHMLSRAIKETKPWVKFGISPFGVWRSTDKDLSGTPTKGALTNYDDLYADVIKWQRLGWIDYLTPQLYWEFGHRLVPFNLLIDWWDQHAYGRHMYIGHAPYRLGTGGGWNSTTEMGRQITATRALKNIHGSAYYNTKSLFQNPLGFTDSLRNHYYNKPALVPTMPWIGSTAPPPPLFADALLRNDGLELRWIDVDTTGHTRYYALYRFELHEFPDIQKSKHLLAIIPQMPDPVFIDNHFIRGKEYVYLVTALDRLHNESIQSDPLYIENRQGRLAITID